jgi:hypothetical protein
MWRLIILFCSGSILCDITLPAVSEAKMTMQMARWSRCVYEGKMQGCRRLRFAQARFPSKLCEFALASYFSLQVLCAD